MKITVTKKVLIVVVCMILLVLILNSMTGIAQFVFDIRPPWFKESPWYEVEQWEKDVCSLWGGTGFAGQEATTTGTRIPFGTLSATAQAHKLKTPDGKFIYDVAWYIDSFQEDISFELTMINPVTDAKHFIYGQTLGPGSGSTNYQVIESDKDYTQLRLTYTGGSVTTRIIEVR